MIKKKLADYNFIGNKLLYIINCENNNIFYTIYN